MPFSTTVLPTDTRVVRLRRWLALINKTGIPSKNVVNQTETVRSCLYKIAAYLHGK